MAFYHKIAVVPWIGRDIGLLGPLLIGRAEAAIPFFLLDGIGQHPCSPPVAEIFQHRIQTAVSQIHSVKMFSDAFLNGLFAGDVFFRSFNSSMLSSSQ